ncbi:MAG: UDP-N-acetylmuramate dehydrogenase [Negativicutes bacterium]|nr:UDP-N-acetylmuramate dehydrogenase [Negativicutes bacterium]
MVFERFKNWLNENMPGCFRENEPMKAHTSFRIGGPADILVMPSDASKLEKVVAEARAEGLPLTIIGNGSNLLVKDKGIRGVVVKLGNALRGMECDGERLIAEAGVSLAAVANKAAACGLTGLEFAVGIPGSIGGAVFMNAGAYDGEMCKVVAKVTVLTADGQVKVFNKDVLEFGYRHSSIQDNGAIIISVEMTLEKGDINEIKAKMADFTNRRTTKQPLDIPNAGSMFRRPPGHYAGTLIEEAGLKGYTVGGAQVSTKHAGFVVNVGDATAADVLRLIGEVQDKVYAHAGVRLEPEVRIYGE